MSAELLHDLYRDGHLKAKELADLLGVGDRSYHPYFDGRELKFAQVRRLICYAAHPAVAERIINELVRETPFVLVRIDESTLDANGDGRLDIDDAMAQAVAGVADNAAILTEVRSAVEDDGQIDDAELTQIEAAADEAIRHAMAVKRIAAAIHAQPGRRKCRPLAAPGTPRNGRGKR